MADIKFNSSEMVGFYAWLIQDPLVFSLKEGKNQDTDWMNCVNNLNESVLKGDIKNIEDFTKSIFDNLPQRFDDAKKIEISDSFNRAFTKYDAFYNSNSEKISEYTEKMVALKDDEKHGYRKELDDLCTFFGVDKEVQLSGILAPIEDKKIDGQAWNKGFIHYISLNEQPPEADYVDGSPVLKSKISTPLHEATHLLFQKAGLEKSLVESQAPGVKKMRDVMADYFKENPQSLLVSVQSIEWNTVRAIDEAMAASSSVVADTKFGKHPENTDIPKVKEWYHGFEGANMMAPQAYLLIQNYIKNGKSLEDNFFGDLADKIKEQEKNRHHEDKGLDNQKGNQSMANRLKELRGCQKNAQNQTKKIDLPRALTTEDISEAMLQKKLTSKNM